MMPDGPPILEGVAPIFVHDFYDVPLSGICTFEGEVLFFTIRSTPDDDPPKRYAVFRLPTEQTAFFLRSKADFERIVGTHFSYSADRPFQRIRGPINEDKTNWRSFYGTPQAYTLEEELKKSTAQLVGFFAW